MQTSQLGRASALTSPFLPLPFSLPCLPFPLLYPSRPYFPSPFLPSFPFPLEVGPIIAAKRV